MNRSSRFVGYLKRGIFLPHAILTFPDRRGGRRPTPGQSLGETILDARVCDCCQTTLARTADGLFAALRDRTESELRHLSVVRQDNWPSVMADGRRVVVAWLTGADSPPGQVQPVGPRRCHHRQIGAG